MINICDSGTCQTCGQFHRCRGLDDNGSCRETGQETKMYDTCDKWVPSLCWRSVFIVHDMNDGGKPLKAFHVHLTAQEAIEQEGLHETDRGFESDDGRWMTIEEVALCRL